MRALRAAFGDEVEIEVAEQVPDVARRLYPGVCFVGGLHSRQGPRDDRPRRGPPVLQSIRWRRTWIAVRLLRWLPALGQRLLSARQREQLARIARADVVVATGGTYFVEHYNFSAKADELLAAQALGKPTFLYTQSMGPFRRPGNRRLMRRIVAGSRGVFLRDERSRRHLLEAGADGAKLSVHADAAFALAGAGDAARAVPPGPPRIAISVRAWAHAHRERDAAGPDAGERYRHAVAAAARTLARAGCEVTFVSTCQGVPEYWTDDSRFAEGLVRDLLPGEARVRVDTRFRAPAELAAALADFDAAIATRMHFAILALSVATPVVAIAYEFKSRELLRGLGLEHLVTDFEEVDGAWLAARVQEVLAGGSALRARLAAAVAPLREDAMRPALLMRERL